MAKKVVRYLLEGNGSVPMFVEDGGHFPRGHEMVGISVDEEARHIPSSVVRMDEEELLEWIKEAHKADGVYLMKNREEEQFTDEDMEAICEAFLEKL